MEEVSGNMIEYVLRHVGNWGIAMVNKRYEEGRGIRETDIKIFYCSKSMIESARCIQFLKTLKKFSMGNGRLENDLENALFNLASVRLRKGKRALQYSEA